MHFTCMAARTSIVNRSVVSGPYRQAALPARGHSPFFIRKTGLVARLSPHRAVTMETRPWRAGATRPPIRPPPLMAAIAGHSRVMC
eukprot:COSAG01_NODE_16432_length_1236_cov_23.302551_2_plen_85_part_01